MTAKKVIIVGLIVLMLESLGGYIYLTYRQDKVADIKQSHLTELTPLPSASPELKKANLSLQSDKTTFKNGEIFKVDLLLNTFAAPVSAADVVIKYDPTFVSLQASASAKPFNSSQLFQKTVFNESNSKQGLATMSAVAEPGKDFTGSSILTSLNFKAIKIGTTAITIVFTPGETRDTNVVSKTEDILESTSDLSVTILP